LKSNSSEYYVRESIFVHKKTSVCSHLDGLRQAARVAKEGFGTSAAIPEAMTRRGKDAYFAK
jgi:hypothetical protein